MRRRRLLIGALVIASLLIVVAVLLTVEHAVAPKHVEAPPAAPPATAIPHITATVFYATPNGQKLLPVRREIPLADAPGVQIVTAQLAAPPPPYVSVIPKGTTLRAFYVTDRGDAFVDLSSEARSGHPGGSTAELLTVYAIVNAVTVNLPAVQRVQILVNGKEVDTLAGHVDLRRPMVRDASLVAQP